MRVREQLRQLGLTLHSQLALRARAMLGRVQPDGRPLRSAARGRQPPEAVSVHRVTADANSDGITDGDK